MDRNKHRLFFLYFVIVILCFVMILGCQPEESTNEANEVEKLTIGMVILGLDHEGYSELHDEAVKTAENIGNIELLVSDTWSTEDQIKALESYVAQGVDLIGFAVLDPYATEGAVRSAVEAGIPVICLVGIQLEDLVIGHVIFNEEEAIREQTQWIIDFLGGEGQVAIIQGTAGCYVNATHMEVRAEMFKDYPGIEVVADPSGEYRRDSSYTVANDLLSRFPDLDMIICANDDTALGALQAVTAQDKLGKIHVTGYNGTKEGLEQVWAGNILVNSRQPWRLTGKTFIEIANGYLKGELSEQDMKVGNPNITIDKEFMEKVSSGELQTSPYVENLILEITN